MKVHEFIKKYGVEVKFSQDNQRIIGQWKDAEVIAWAMVEGGLPFREDYSSQRSREEFIGKELFIIDLGKLGAGGSMRYVGFANGMREPVEDVAMAIERLKVERKAVDVKEHPQLGKLMLIGSL